MQKQLTLAELVGIIREHDLSIDDLVERYGEHEIKIEELAAIVKALQSADAPALKKERPKKQKMLKEYIRIGEQILDSNRLCVGNSDAVGGAVKCFEHKTLILGPVRYDSRALPIRLEIPTKHFDFFVVYDDRPPSRVRYYRPDGCDSWQILQLPICISNFDSVLLGINGLIERYGSTPLPQSVLDSLVVFEREYSTASPSKFCEYIHF